MTNATRPETLRHRRQRVWRALVHLEDHLDGDLSLARVATAAHLSAFHFQRIFAHIVGESPKRLVRRLRLERAAAALARGGAPTAAVARAAGYASVEPFTRAFAAHFGTPPGRYRANAARRRDAAPRPPEDLRSWVNRPGRDGQLRFAAVAARAGRDGAAAFRLERIFPFRAAFRRRGPGVRRDEAELERLLEFARRGARAPASPLIVVLHHDDPAVVPPERRRVDLGVAVGPRRSGEGDVAVRPVAGGDYAAATHGGPRRRLPRTLEWLRSAARSAGLGPRDGPVLEVPLGDPRSPGWAASALVDVLLPVESGAKAGTFYLRRAAASGRRGARPSKTRIETDSPAKKKKKNRKRR